MKLTRSRLRWVPLLAVVGIASLTSSFNNTASAASVAAVCTPGPSYEFVADLGYIITPDSNLLPMWSYADLANNAGTFQFPGPVICVNVGETVTVSLTNNLPEPTSIVFPGQSNVLANGVPSEPEFAGAALTSMAPTAAANGGTMNYSFVATKPGTFLYESGTNTDKQREMGLYGAIIIRPAANQIYDASSSFTPTREFLQILGEADPTFHAAVENGENPDPSTRVSKYFFINGRSMPDTISPNDSPFLPAQPYSGLIHIIEDEKAAIRYVNAGSHNYPFHPHGNDTQIIGLDGMPLRGTETSDSGQDLSFPKFLIDVAPGQTVDATFTWHDDEHYASATNPVPAVLPQVAQLGITGDTFYSLSPYFGVKDPLLLPPGVRQTSQCGEYYHMAHSHALEQSTNFGAAFGGMMTLYRVDPNAASASHTGVVC
jgi:Multicopper oxidase